VNLDGIHERAVLTRELLTDTGAEMNTVIHPEAWAAPFDG